MKTVPTESARAAVSRRWDRFASSVALWPRMWAGSSPIWSHRHWPPRVSDGRRFSGPGASSGVAKRNRLEESVGCRME